MVYIEYPRSVDFFLILEDDLLIFFGGNVFEQKWVCQKIINNGNNEWYVYFYEHQRTSVWVGLNIGCPLV